MCQPMIPVFVDTTVGQPFHSVAVVPHRSMSDSQERLINYIYTYQSGFGIIGRTGRGSATGKVLHLLFLRAQPMTHGLN